MALHLKIPSIFDLPIAVPSSCFIVNVISKVAVLLNISGGANTLNSFFTMVIFPSSSLNSTIRAVRKNGHSI